MAFGYSLVSGCFVLRRQHRPTKANPERPLCFRLDQLYSEVVWIGASCLSALRWSSPSPVVIGLVARGLVPLAPTERRGPPIELRPLQRQTTRGVSNPQVGRALMSANADRQPYSKNFEVRRLNRSSVAMQRAVDGMSLSAKARVGPLPPSEISRFKVRVEIALMSSSCVRRGLCITPRT